jgi:hypothetical protein
MPASRALTALVAVSLLAICASSGGAQLTRCNVVDQPGANTHFTKVAGAGGVSTVYAGGGVNVDCPSKKITLKSDSAEIYENDRVYLVGHVKYDEPRVHMESDFLTYFLKDERIFAYQNVHGRLPTGSTMQGPQAEYLRAVPRIRARAHMTAIGRPTFSIVERDAQGKEQPPVTVLANTVVMDGDSLIYGSGDVFIQRPELTAHGDSAFIDSGRETMRLMRQPKVNGTRSRPFTLEGELIDSYSRNRKLQRVVARGRGVATSQDLTLRADTIDLRINDDALERAISWATPGKSAVAVSPTQHIVADSIDVRMPQQRVREVHAVRRAFAEGKADSTKFHADTTDWMRGDTIVAFFDSTTKQRDTTKSPPIRELLALGHARSYYNMPPQDTTQRRPALSYVTGKRIRVVFDSSQVSTVVVYEQTGGVYLEPSSDTTRANARTPRVNTQPGARTPGRQTPLPSRPRP